MPHARPHKRKKAPKRVLALPDLEHAKSAVLSSLTSRSGQRTYDHAIREFVAWYCSEPRLAFNRTLIIQGDSYRLKQKRKAGLIPAVSHPQGALAGEPARADRRKH